MDGPSWRPAKFRRREAENCSCIFGISALLAVRYFCAAKTNKPRWPFAGQESKCRERMDAQERPFGYFSLQNTSVRFALRVATRFKIAPDNFLATQRKVTRRRRGVWLLY
jgi:hypothetical protein